MSQFDCIKAMKALSEPHRLRIVRFLLAESHGVNEIADALQISQYNVSRHLRILREAGLVESEKLGRLRQQTLASEFRERLSSQEMILDLGCCQFDFEKLPS